MNFIFRLKNLDLIKNVGLTPEVRFETLIVFFLEHKLDFNSRKEFESDRDSNQIPTIDIFFKFLKNAMSCLTV